MIPMWGVPAGELGVELKQEKVKERERGKRRKQEGEKKGKRKRKKGLGVRNPRMMMLMKQNLPPQVPPNKYARVCCYLDPTMPALLYRTLSL